MRQLYADIDQLALLIEWHEQQAALLVLDNVKRHIFHNNQAELLKRIHKSLNEFVGTLSEQ